MSPLCPLCHKEQCAQTRTSHYCSSGLFHELSHIDVHAHLKVKKINIFKVAHDTRGDIRDHSEITTGGGGEGFLWWETFLLGGNFLGKN